MRRRIDYNDYMNRNQLYQVVTKTQKVIGVINPIATNHETLSVFEQETFKECQFPVEDILKVNEVWD